MNKTNQIVLLIIIVLTSFVGLGQKLNNSPYTRYGIGEITEQTSATYFGMSSTSVALSEFNHLNISNPASYSGLIKYKPIFDVGVYGKIQNLRTSASSSNRTNFALRNFTLGLPIGTKTGIAFGLMPYSTVGYDINSYDVIEGDSLRYNYEGQGGINRVFLGAGREIINKSDSIKLSIGANLSYLFGTIDNSRAIIYDNSTFYNSKVNDFKTVSGVNVDLGLQYSQLLKNNLKLQVGLNYTLNSQLNVTKDFYAYNFKYTTFSVVETSKDTIESNEGQKGKLSIPNGLKLGAALTFNNKLTLALQYEQKSWNNYSEIYDGENNTATALNKSSKIAVGLSYTPTPMKDWNSKSRSIFQKSTYRFGLKFANTNISVNDEQIKDYGISFGISTPLLSSRSFSSIDLGLDLGRLGTRENNLIEDNYLKIYLGFSLSPSNYDRWFRKRKYD